MLAHVLSKYDITVKMLVKLMRDQDHGRHLSSVIQAAADFQQHELSTTNTTASNQDHPMPDLPPEFFLAGTKISSRSTTPPQSWPLIKDYIQAPAELNFVTHNKSSVIQSTYPKINY